MERSEIRVSLLFFLWISFHFIQIPHLQLLRWGSAFGFPAFKDHFLNFRPDGNQARNADDDTQKRGQMITFCGARARKITEENEA
jgi:hypothetical protein